MRGRVIASWSVAACVLGGVLSAATGVPQTPAGPDVARAVESAKALKAAGKSAEAATALASVLKQSPTNTEAATLQVETLVELDRFDEALKTYDAYAAALKKPDLAVLNRLGRADLARTVRSR